ncbi:unnamed protein product [Phytophthora fragariaefolia]|uniref:Unnamed protein product n=1 Tax=Phytophthora fragariaefolia TaxID=1490495 RepID=A0A9W6Y1K8_9STRA|nr:unnamed protein product [Phytophthora fragariaefolia]
MLHVPLRRQVLKRSQWLRGHPKVPSGPVGKNEQTLFLVANPPRDEWKLEKWPDDVPFISAQLNPRHWKFPAVSAGVRGGIGCGCEDRCNATTCLNARSSRFCTEYNCTFTAECGNGLHESRALAIGRNRRTGMRGLVAQAAIPAGEVIGQYLGHMDLFGPPCKNGPVNNGYRMHLRTRSTGNKFVGIDALEVGGNLRFMNHACNSSARFHEVQTGQRLTVVAVSYQNYSAKEELLLSDLAAKPLPTGRNMWMALAAEYNDSKDPHWRERDFDSLRRKFRKLYGKHKPTGNPGDRLTLKQRAVLLAHETQYEIEKKEGAHTSHDGHDNGDDDAALMNEVNAALFEDEVNRTFNGRSKTNSDFNRERISKQREEEGEEEDEAEETSISSVNSVEDEKASEAGTSEAAVANQVPPLPPVSELQGGDATSAGAVMTEQGLVPIEFAADFLQTNANLGDEEESDAQGY